MDNHADVMRAIGRLEGKIDGLTQANLVQAALHTNQLKEHDTRLHKVEKSQSTLFGGVAVAATLLSGAVVTGLRKVGVI